jgi:hypothetical protein
MTGQWLSGIIYAADIQGHAFEDVVYPLGGGQHMLLLQLQAKGLIISKITRMAAYSSDESDD